MRVTYGRERSKAARRATVDISPEFGTGGLDEGRDEPLAAYIITVGATSCARTHSGIRRCLHSQSASSAAT